MARLIHMENQEGQGYNGWVLSPQGALPVTGWKSVEYPSGSSQFVQAFFRKDKLTELPDTYCVHCSEKLEQLALLCQKAGLKAEDIPCHETPDFSRAVQKARSPGSPGAKATGINIAILDRRLDWFFQHH